MKEGKNQKYKVSFFIILIIVFVSGVLIGINWNSLNSAYSTKHEINDFEEVFSLIKTEYVDEVEIKVLIDDAIRHVLSQLDPHSIYLSETEKKEANEYLHGSFDGVGIEFNIFMDTLVVITPLSDGPAATAGIYAGDKIIRIDNENVAGIGLTNQEVVKRLKGPQNTKVEVTILRKYVESPMGFTITRNKIPQSSVNASYMVNADIGYIKVSRFSKTTYSEFKEAVSKLKKKGMSKLILDLQGNPGGYMNQAINIVDDFLPADKKIVYTKGKNKRYNSNAISTHQSTFKKEDLILLINEGSSSASEIVAGALQDNDRAIIVGRRSYGKGLVQSPFNLSSGAELRLTTSRYYTPIGRSIQKPYSDNHKYSGDITQRYQHGEFFHADSIHFNDSMKYTTLRGRTVYGGGGIMPDHFVPLDTTSNSHHINILFNSNSIQEYAFHFALDNKSTLVAMGVDAFRKDFDVTDKMVKDLMKIGKRNKVNLNHEHLSKNRATFDILLKANIARRIWGNDGFYPIFNETNEVLRRAIQLFDNKTTANMTDNIPSLPLEVEK